MLPALCSCMKASTSLSTLLNTYGRQEEGDAGQGSSGRHLTDFTTHRAVAGLRCRAGHLAGEALTSILGTQGRKLCELYSGCPSCLSLSSK